MGSEESVVGVFAGADDLLRGIKMAGESGYEVRRVFSPIRLEGIEEIKKERRSPVPFFTLVGGIAGGVNLVALAVYAHLSFRLITGSKPVLPVVPWVVVCFEGTVLLAVIVSVCAWILKGGLPRVRPPAGYDPRFSGEQFGLVVAGLPQDRDALSRLLEEAGASEVRRVNG